MYYCSTFPSIRPCRQDYHFCVCEFERVIPRAQQVSVLLSGRGTVVACRLRRPGETTIDALHFTHSLAVLQKHDDGHTRAPAVRESALLDIRLSLLSLRPRRPVPESSTNSCSIGNVAGWCDFHFGSRLWDFEGSIWKRVKNALFFLRTRIYASSNSTFIIKFFCGYFEAISFILPIFKFESIRITSTRCF